MASIAELEQKPAPEAPAPSQPKSAAAPATAPAPPPAAAADADVDPLDAFMASLDVPKPKGALRPAAPARSRLTRRCSQRRRWLLRARPPSPPHQRPRRPSRRLPTRTRSKPSWRPSPRSAALPAGRRGAPGRDVRCAAVRRRRLPPRSAPPPPPERARASTTTRRRTTPWRSTSRARRPRRSASPPRPRTPAWSRVRAPRCAAGGRERVARPPARGRLCGCCRLRERRLQLGRRGLRHGGGHHAQRAGGAGPALVADPGTGTAGSRGDQVRALPQELLRGTSACARTCARLARWLWCCCPTGAVVCRWAADGPCVCCARSCLPRWAD
jgi:hypothetical protein